MLMLQFIQDSFRRLPRIPSPLPIPKRSLLEVRLRPILTLAINNAQHLTDTLLRRNDPLDLPIDRNLRHVRTDLTRMNC